jgi:isocitrate dehydrogenase
MLSIVKLMDGGGLFETGAGGSAPKHVQQLMDENHLRWDSLGEFCALGESLKYLATVKNNKKAKVLGEAVDQATQGILDQNRSPGRKVSQPDNRTSHFYFALYWAKALATQSDDLELAGHFEPIAKALSENENTILEDFSSPKGKPADTGGYFHNDDQKTEKIMRPSNVFNKIIKLASELK